MPLLRFSHTPVTALIDSTSKVGGLRRILRSAVVLALCGAGPARASLCDVLLRRPPPLGRDGTKASASVLKTYAEERERAPGNAYFTLARPGDVPSQMVMNLATELAQASGLTRFLSNPGPLAFYLERRDSEGIPKANQMSGVVRINRSMLDIARNDDDLAEIVGHEILHHFLAHTQRLIALSQTWLARQLNERGSEDWLGQTDFFGELDRIRRRHNYEKMESEIHAALPRLMSAAGFDPWAMVRVAEAQREASARAGRPFFDFHDLRKLDLLVENHRTRMFALGLREQPLPRPDHRLKALREAMDVAHAAHPDPDWVSLR